MSKEEIDEIVKECIKETKITYRPAFYFFRPRLKKVHHLGVERSRITSNPLALLLQWLYYKVDTMRDAIVAWWHRLTPRHEFIHGSHIDGYIVGRLTFTKLGEPDVPILNERGEPVLDEHGKPRFNKREIPIHNKRVQLWARTKFFQWRKLAGGLTDQNGYFKLPYDLRAARAWVIRKKLHFEIYQVTDIVRVGETMKINKILFKKILFPKSDLIGMEYNLRTIQLFFWEYEEMAGVPRVVILKDGDDAPEQYSHGRVEAMDMQVIPIELLKRKHLRQIARNDGSLTLRKIQEDYPENLTVAIEKRLPGYTRGDDWFGERFMNGMSMATFIPDKINPEHYWVKYFGACLYKVNEEYAFPTAEIKFRLKEDGLPLPIEIHLTGPLNAKDKDLFQKKTFTPADGDAWLQAKRVARVTAALCGELDQHLAGTHLNTEQYSIAIHRNLRLNPVVLLLMPHVKSVSLIDHTANSLLIKGYIPNATALTIPSTEERARDILGFQDWKGWKPMMSISPAHLYAQAENLFWKVLGEWVDMFFEQHEAAIKTHWLEIYRFSTELVEHAVPLFSSTMDLEKLSPREKELVKNRIEYLTEEYRLDPGLIRINEKGQSKAVSPITTSRVYKDDSNDLQNLKDACRYIIMTATFLHTWVNEHQYDDIGEVLYSCLGLRFGGKESGIMSPESDLTIAPDLTRSTQMMWFSNLLSRTEYGFIVENEQGDMDPRFIKLLLSKKDEFKELRVDVRKIESRTNI